MDTDIINDHDEEDDAFLSPGNFSSCDDGDGHPSPLRSRPGLSEDEADDEDAEDQTVFDRTVLLDSKRAKSFQAAGKDPTCKIVGTGGSHLSGVTPLPASPSPHRKLRLLTTAFLFASFFALGMGVSIVGPTLLDLAQNVHVDVDQISSLFPARSGGYLVGSIVGGFLADSVNISCAMALPLFICAISSTLIPWMSHTWTLGVTMTIKGFGSGMLDTVGNVFGLRLWPNSPPTIQALHFFFGFGAFTAPLLAEPFLTPNPNISLAVNGSLLPGKANVSASLFSHTFHPIHGSPLLHQQLHLISNSSIAKISSRALKDIGAPPPLTSPREKREKRDISVPISGPVPVSSISESGISESIPDSASSMAVAPVTSPSGEIQSNRLGRWAVSLLDKMRNTTLGGSSNNASLTDVAADLAEAFISAALRLSSNVEMPYLILGSAYFFLSVSLLTLCCFRARSLRMIASTGKEDDDRDREATDAGMALLDGDPYPSNKRHPSQQRRKRTSRNKEEKAFKIRVLVLLFVFFALYVGMEVTYGGFILTYAVRGPPKMTKDRGAFLTSVFWGCFSLGRLFGIPLSRALSPAVLLLLDVFLTCFSAMGLILSGRKIDSILWVCSGTLGFGMSSIFACGVNWAEQYISMTGKATAVLVVAAATGEMVVPIVVGQLFDRKGPISLMYVVLGVAVGTGIIFLLLLRLAVGRKPIGRRGGGGGGGVGRGADSGETSGFLTDMETLDGGLIDDDDDDDDGDLGSRSMSKNDQTSSFFDKLRTSNKNNGHRRPTNGQQMADKWPTNRRPTNGKRVTFNFNDQHEYQKLTG